MSLMGENMATNIKLARHDFHKIDFWDSLLRDLPHCGQSEFSKKSDFDVTANDSFFRLQSFEDFAK